MSQSNIIRASQSKVDFQEPTQDPIEILLRQIDNMIKRDMSGNNQIAPRTSYSKLYKFASSSDKLLMGFGWAAAMITGCGMPSFVFLIGNIIDSFKPTANVDDTLETISTMSLIFTCVGIGVWMFAYVLYSFLLLFSERVVRKTRTQYLKAILSQESAWFDQINASELSSKLSKESSAMQKALGEKMGTIIMAISMCIAGLTFAFTRGWSFSLVLLAAFPFLMITTQLMATVQAKGSQETMKAYGQSAGYADQALNAIRVVVAYGQEQKEVQNYTKYLIRAKIAGIKTHCKGAVTMAFFFASIFGTYAYAFYLGSVWIYNDFWNHTFERYYSAGDILSCFFGVIFGMFSLGLAAPNIKAVTEGQVAGKLAFDVIERRPQIDQDAPGKDASNIDGNIEFKNVNFYYPSRPDHQVLTNFSCVFEKGKTTAIVGPSGSGKSTIVQLLERFYDPYSGDVLIDGVNLKDYNLRTYRQKVGYVGQEPVLFNTTIKENILMGCPGKTDEEIRSALKESNALEFIEKRTEGINMFVGSGGGQISGGQKQRVAIARAFIKKPKVLIFDEATSALDKKNEAEVQSSINAIRDKLQGVTTVVIAHRLSTIRQADKIVVLKKGRLTEIGNHDTLLKNYPNGVYATLVKQQQMAESGMTEEEHHQHIQQSPDIHDYKTGNERDHVHAPHLNNNKPEHTELDLKALMPSGEKVHETATAVIERRPTTDKKKKEEPGEKKMTKEELEKKEITDKKDEEEDSKEKAIQDQLLKEGFFKRLNPYNKPFIYVVCGVCVSVIQGGIFPSFGLFIVKMLFSLFIVWDKEKLRSESDIWCLAMFICCIVSFITGFTQKFLFGIIGENITLNIREKLYGALLRKNIGWFDRRENAPGVLNSVLASDVQALNGASTEGTAVVMESTFAMIVGIAIGFSFNWKISLVALGCVPFMVLGGAINTKFQTGYSNVDDDAYKDANLLAGDSILNYRTVASFGHDSMIIQKYDELIDAPVRNSIKRAQCIGFWFGFSQFVQNAVFALLYWAGAMFQKGEGMQNGENLFIATFAMMFGSFAAGQANQYGPDMGKAKKAGTTVFTFIDTPSKINAVDIPEGSIEVPPTFKGEIEFKDVWFRYPTRKTEWVFTGLNLKIHPNESVAIVGESGCGKSTLVNLILRFYDPDHGVVMIDGVDIKKYNLKQLRKRMGLVMQEPTLFNYTIKENILYGKQDAKESEIREAVAISNALEFIESNDLQLSYEDSASVLRNAFVEKKDIVLKKIQNQYNEEIPKRMEAWNAVPKNKNHPKSHQDIVLDIYNEILGKLNHLTKKEEQEGKFQSMKGEMDERDDSKRDITLHQGFEIECGIKGGKLSGGQKQRIAIARAVIRKPNILILDEATSALDEKSQSLVQKALEQVMDGRTSIVIAHRLTTVEKCNRVVVIEHGKVVEEGKFNELKSNADGHFANLAKGMNRQEKQERKISQHHS